MKYQNVLRHLPGCVTVASVLTMVFVGSLAWIDIVRAEIKQDVFIESIQRLYGLDEQGAIDRIAKEEETADLAVSVESLDLDGFAGMWFDERDGVLVVAVTESRSAAIVERIGAKARQVDYSLRDLQGVRKNFEERLQAEFRSTGKTGYKSYIDFVANRVVFALRLEAASWANAVIERELLSPMIDVEPYQGGVQLSSGNVRGGNEYYNVDKDWSCSIGVSVTNGFYTAGHCGSVQDEIESPGGVTMGQMAATRWNAGRDAGHVTTVSGWNLQPYINGYSDGLITVPSRFSGTREALINSTVCRYGYASASSGPHCGTITAKDVDDTSGFTVILGMTEVSSTCSDGGDSGGPFLSPSGQVQGTNIGADVSDTCPESVGSTYFQPIEDHIDNFPGHVRTTHGAYPPTIHGFNCPDPANSGGGVFFCEIDHFKAQGQTTMQWTSGFGNPSSSATFFGSCNEYDWVTVDLQVSNDYGTAQESAGFVCPTGPNP